MGFAKITRIEHTKLSFNKTTVASSLQKEKMEIKCPSNAMLLCRYTETSAMYGMHVDTVFTVSAGNKELPVICYHLTSVTIYLQDSLAACCNTDLLIPLQMQEVNVWSDIFLSGEQQRECGVFNSQFYYDSIALTAFLKPSV